MLNQRSDKLELLRIVEAVATEKSIDKEIILFSMESAIQKAAKTRFGLDSDIRAIINRENGDISLHKVLKIVETPKNFNTEISLEHAIKKEKKENINYEKLSKLAKNFEYELINGDLLNLGHILNENWMLKKNLHKTVSNLNLNEIYDDAISAGAIGGKLLGAGGGGYFLFLVKPEKQSNVKKRLSKFKKY